MTNDSFINLRQVSDEFAIRLLQSIHHSAMVNGLTGSLRDVYFQIDPEAAFHLGGILTSLSGTDTASDVIETLQRLSPREVWEPYITALEAWVETLSDHQRLRLNTHRIVDLSIDSTESEDGDSDEFDQEKHLRELRSRRFDDLAEQVIAMIKGLGPEHRTSGDDSGLDDVWEEFKDQVQNGESVLWDAYEETIQGMCAALVKELSPLESFTLWYSTDGYFNWNEQRDPEPPYDPQDLVLEIYGRIRSSAAYETLKSESETDEVDDNEDEETDGVEEIKGPHSEILLDFGNSETS